MEKQEKESAARVKKLELTVKYVSHIYLAIFTTCKRHQFIWWHQVVPSEYQPHQLPGGVQQAPTKLTVPGGVQRAPTKLTLPGGVQRAPTKLTVPGGVQQAPTKLTVPGGVNEHQPN